MGAILIHGKFLRIGNIFLLNSLHSLTTHPTYFVIGHWPHHAIKRRIAAPFEFFAILPAGLLIGSDRLLTSLFLKLPSVVHTHMNGNYHNSQAAKSVRWTKTIVGT